MKSDKDLLMLCIALYNEKSNNETVSKNVTRKQKSFFKILLKKFRDSLVNNKDKSNGILRIRFESTFWKEPDEGYNLLKDLIVNNCDYLAQI